MLPSLRTEVDRLREIRETVDGIFSLDSLPDEREIRRLESTLSSGGFLRWFKGDWRAARKQVLSYATNAQIKLPKLMPLLDNLADFVSKRKQIEGNSRYKEALGGYLKGADTDLQALDSLRYWYKRVRQQYGIGFGPKVPLGDGILELSPSIARAVRSLSDRGVQKQIGDLLDDLNSLEQLLSPVFSCK